MAICLVQHQPSFERELVPQVTGQDQERVYLSRSLEHFVQTSAALGMNQVAMVLNQVSYYHGAHYIPGLRRICVVRSFVSDAMCLYMLIGVSFPQLMHRSLLTTLDGVLLRFPL